MALGQSPWAGTELCRSPRQQPASGAGTGLGELPLEAVQVGGQGILSPVLRN